MYADTNSLPATTLLLDEKTVMALTAGLEQHANPPKFAGEFSSIGSGGTTFLINHWAAEFATLYPDVEMEIHVVGLTEGLSELLEGKSGFSADEPAVAGGKTSRASRKNSATSRRKSSWRRTRWACL